MSKFEVLNDSKIEAILTRLYQESDRQLGSLLLYYVPQLPSLLLGKGIKWDRSKTNLGNSRTTCINP